MNMTLRRLSNMAPAGEMLGVHVGLRKDIGFTSASRRGV